MGARHLDTTGEKDGWAWRKGFFFVLVSLFFTSTGTVDWGIFSAFLISIYLFT